MTLRQSWFDRRLAYDSNGRLDVSMLRIYHGIIRYFFKEIKFLYCLILNIPSYSFEKVKVITLKHEEYGKKIWIPDTFMRNDVSGRGHGIIESEPDNYIRIFPDGKVMYSIR